GGLPPDLLVTAQRPAVEAHHVQVELPPQQPARRPGGAQLVACQEIPIERRPLQEILLLVVVGDERDPLPRLHRQLLISHVARASPEPTARLRPRSAGWSQRWDERGACWDARAGEPRRAPRGPRVTGRSPPPPRRASRHAPA